MKSERSGPTGSDLENKYMDATSQAPTAAGHQAAGGNACPVPVGDHRHGIVVVGGSRYSWRPPAVIASRVPTGYRLELECRLVGGARCFLPAGGIPGFVVQASLAGLALLARLQRLTKEQEQTYDRMRFVWQQAPLVREHLTRGFHAESDLYAAYATGDQYDVLPDGLGLDTAGAGERVRPGELMAAGAAAARAAGSDAPSTAECIRRGLLEFARANPIDPRALQPEHALSLVRMALFDLPDGPKASEEQVATVFGKLADAMCKHERDDQTAFNEWLFGPVADKVKSIAQRKGGGGRLPREIARRAYLELVWRSHEYAANCVRNATWSFAAALPEPLTATERALFDALYSGQTYLGGLPLVLVQGRFDFLAEALQAVWVNPHDGQAVGALLRMLAYYGEMANKRRAADANAKRRGHARDGNENVAGEVPLDPERDQRELEEPDEIERMAAAIAAIKGVQCPCGADAKWQFWVAEGLDPSRPFPVRLECRTCGVNQSVICTTAEFQ
jgi:hypothetical protein